MSFGRGPLRILAPRQPDEPEPQRAPAPARAAFVPTSHPPMIGMGPEGVQRHFNPQYTPLGGLWRKIKVSPGVNKPTDV
jgi:hypothetical protein